MLTGNERWEEYENGARSDDSSGHSKPVYSTVEIHHCRKSVQMYNNNNTRTDCRGFSALGLSTYDRRQHRTSTTLRASRGCP